MSEIVPKLVPIDEVAESLGCHRDTVYKLIQAGELRSVHVFKRHLVRLESLREYVDRHESDHGQPRMGRRMVKASKPEASC